DGIRDKLVTGVQTCALPILLAAVVESSSDAVIACSLDGAVQSWNAAAERFFGHTAAEMRGRPLSEVLPAGDESLLALIDSAVHRSEERRVGEEGRDGGEAVQ